MPDEWRCRCRCRYRCDGKGSRGPLYLGTYMRLGMCSMFSSTVSRYTNFRTVDPCGSFHAAEAQKTKLRQARRGRVECLRVLGMGRARAHFAALYRRETGKRARENQAHKPNDHLQPSTRQFDNRQPRPSLQHTSPIIKMGGVSVKDVDAQKFINAYAAFLKRQGKLPMYV